jgi:2-polyprenyl-3-methyl-5-hydroxy-6-metoxy-1,4-benzoquinol methylase/spore coat polysaccharide biosynthesis predicted glycosyltransferase SpsG
MSRSILLVPSVIKGNGSGHIVRCLSLARAFGRRSSVYVPEVKSETNWSAAELSLAYARELSGVRIVSQLPAAARRIPWDLVVLDRRATSPDELASWERYAPVVAIDEGGEARASAHYLIDILPRHPRASGFPANRSGVGLLDLPKSRRSRPREFKRILVSFGGEDRAGLTLALSRILVAEGYVAPSDLTVVSGALRRGAPPVGLEGATILGPVQDLKEHLSRYDLVFTQFGLTAFEAAWAGCGVVLLNPSRYHRELARRAGFPEIGLLRPDRAALRRFLRAPSDVFAMLAGLVPEETGSLADCIAGLAPAGSRDCPSCGGSPRVVQHRDPAKSFFRCSSCGMVYMLRFSPGRENPYTESYFFEEYRRQYGKTYLEDWPALTALAERRLDIIEELARSSLGRAKGLSVLDVGCAYGPFLAAARDRGQEAYGLDASEEAAAYVRRELGIPASSGDFLDGATASTFGGPFDVLSMWYVIEHFQRLDKALRNAASLVRPGGVLALSTPSLEGASGRFDREGFFARSPEDHFTVWEPSRARAILKTYGFRVERIRVTGHHPERLPGLGFLASKARRNGFDTVLAGVGGLLSRAFGLGDTFELYAVREGVPDFRGSPGASPESRARRGAMHGPKDARRSR